MQLPLLAMRSPVFICIAVDFFAVPAPVADPQSEMRREGGLTEPSVHRIVHEKRRNQARRPRRTATDP